MDEPEKLRPSVEDEMATIEKGQRPATLLASELRAAKTTLPGESSGASLFLTVYSSIFLQNRGLRNHRGGVAPGQSPPGADGSTC